MNVGERYVLGRLVGEGATALVYEAQDSRSRREVAVKVFRDLDLGGGGGVERIDEETRILASLAHPSLLPVYDSGRDADGHRFIVMPLVRGTTLAKRLVDGPVGPAEVRRIGRALSLALAHIHARGIVHRDVKPSNVLLADDGTPYLADFGFARAADGPALTATGYIVGTAGYLAPEQADGLPVTPAVDVYALGLVLLEALTGERAYRGTPLERATANALRPPHIPARLGPGWLKVLRGMTARSPSVRPTAGEVDVLLGAGEDEFPAVTPFGDTMELPLAGPVSAPPSGASGSAHPAVSGPAGLASPVARAAGAAAGAAAAAGRPRAHRRPAAFGAAAFAAFVLIGLGADWLALGASADTRVPVPATPGAGAAGPAQSPASTATPALVPAADPGRAAVTESRVHSTPSQSAHAPSASMNCPGGGGQNGNGHGKQRCRGGGGNGEH